MFIRQIIGIVGNSKKSFSAYYTFLVCDLDFTTPCMMVGDLEFTTP